MLLRSSGLVSGSISEVESGHVSRDLESGSIRSIVPGSISEI